MSRILRHVIEAPKIIVGEKHLDIHKEKEAQNHLMNIFPTVAVTTDPNGAKFLPIQEVFKIEQVFQEEKVKSNKAGYKSGYDAGLNKGLEEAQKVLRQFDTAINDIVSLREAVFEEARKEILQLVTKISEKVTFGAIKADPEITLKIISGVIDTLIDRSKLKIKVNPQHLPIVEQNIDNFLRESTAIKDIVIEADPRVKFGGCFIETPTGDIDARLDSQFEVIKDLLESDGGE